MKIHTWYKIFSLLLSISLFFLIAFGIKEEITEITFSSSFILIVAIFTFMIFAFPVYISITGRSHKYYISIYPTYVEINVPTRYVKCQWDEIETISRERGYILYIRVRKNCDTIKYNPHGIILFGSKRGFQINNVFFSSIDIDLLENTLNHYIHLLCKNNI